MDLKAYRNEQKRTDEGENLVKLLQYKDRAVEHLSKFLSSFRKEDGSDPETVHPSSAGYVTI